MFVDDAEPNIEVAAALGLHLVHHQDAAVITERTGELIPDSIPM